MASTGTARSFSRSPSPRALSVAKSARCSTSAVGGLLVPESDPDAELADRVLEVIDQFGWIEFGFGGWRLGLTGERACWLPRRGPSRSGERLGRILTQQSERPRLLAWSQERIDDGFGSMTLIPPPPVPFSLAFAASSASSCSNRSRSILAKIRSW